MVEQSQRRRQSDGGDNLFLKLFAVPIGLAAVYFLYTVASGLLLLFLAVFIAIGLDGPVSRLERRGLSRHSAALIVLGAFFAVIIGVCWLVLPRVAEQLVALVNGFPELVTRASQSLSDALENYPDLQRAVQLNGPTMGSLAPDAVKFLVGIGGASFKLLADSVRDINNAPIFADRQNIPNITGCHSSMAPVRTPTTHTAATTTLTKSPGPSRSPSTTSPSIFIAATTWSPRVGSFSRTSISPTRFTRPTTSR